MTTRSTRDLQYAALFDIQRKPGARLRDALYASLVKTISEGRFQPGQMLPSSRQLAASLDLSRNTVVATYQQLVLDGLIVSAARSGYRVNPEIRPVSAAPADPLPAALPAADAAFPGGSGRKFPGSVIDLPRIYKDQRWRKCRYKFIFGQSDPSTFPAAHWRQIERDINSLDSITNWTREAYDFDEIELIEELCRNILPQRGLWPEPDEVMITAGSQNGIYLVARLILAAGSVAAIEDPGYVDAGSIFRLNGARIALVPVDGHGLRPACLPARCDLIYCTPSRQFPTTVELSLERRRQLADYAERCGAYILEDDYDSELPFDDVQVPSLRAIAGPRAIYLGSFSKTLAPGLRIGYVVAAPAVIRELRAMRRMVIRNPSINNQAALGRFVRQGYYAAHLQRMRRIYRERYEVLSQALGDLAPQLDIAPVTGGTALWATLPPGLEAGRLQRRLIEKSVFIENGDVFHAVPPLRSTVRIGYSSIPVGLIRAGAELIGEELADQLRLAPPA